MTTTRRSILGLLASAPIVAPILAKTAIDSRSRLFGFEFGSTALLGEIPSEQVLSRRDYARFVEALGQSGSHAKELRELMHAPLPWEIPNRLFGAALTSEGDAI